MSEMMLLHARARQSLSHPEAEVNGAILVDMEEVCEALQAALRDESKEVVHVWIKYCERRGHHRLITVEHPVADPLDNVRALRAASDAG